MFGPNCDVVLGHPAIRRAVDPQGIFNYLYAHMVPAPCTIFSEVEKHKWSESEKTGQDLGWHWASEDWLNKHFEKWQQKQSGSWWK